MLARRAAAVLAVLVMAGDAACAATPPGFDARLRRRNHEPLLPHPEILHPQDIPPLPSGFTMTIAASGDGGAALAEKPLQLPREVARRLLECWNPPTGKTGEITVRVQFSRSGAVIGEPRVSYIKADPGFGERDELAASIRKAIADCTPLRFTPAFGAAIAGYPFAIRFIADGRKT